MALIACPECGHGVSTAASSCPNCGYHTATLPGSLVIHRKKQVQASILLMKVFVDGMQCATARPGQTCTIEGLDAGTHHIMIEFGPKDSTEGRIQIRAGQTLTGTASVGLFGPKVDWE